MFQISPPTGYLLLQNFGVTQDGKRLAAANPGEYRFPLQIAPGSVSKLRVSYRAQGKFTPVGLLSQGWLPSQLSDDNCDQGA